MMTLTPFMTSTEFHPTRMLLCAKGGSLTKEGVWPGRLKWTQSSTLQDTYPAEVRTGVGHRKYFRWCVQSCVRVAFCFGVGRHTNVWLCIGWSNSCFFRMASAFSCRNVGEHVHVVVTLAPWATLVLACDRDNDKVKSVISSLGLWQTVERWWQEVWYNFTWDSTFEHKDDVPLKTRTKRQNDGMKQTSISDSLVKGGHEQAQPDANPDAPATVAGHLSELDFVTLSCVNVCFYF